ARPLGKRGRPRFRGRFSLRSFLRRTASQLEIHSEADHELDRTVVESVGHFAVEIRVADREGEQAFRERYGVVDVISGYTVEDFGEITVVAADMQTEFEVVAERDRVIQ